MAEQSKVGPTARGGAQEQWRRGGVCRQLQSKGMFIEVEPDPTVPSMSDGFVWCMHSMNCLGPDGQVADRETCRSGRACFEE